MATYVPHVRLAWGGELGAPAAEIWSNTVKWANDGSIEPTREGLVAAAEAIAVPLSGWMSNPLSNIGKAAKLTWLKLNWIQANGRQRDTDTVMFDITPAVEGGAPTVGGFSATPPWYQTFALTLRTGVSRGRGHSGRIFPPVSGVQCDVSSTPYIPPQKATDMATSFAQAIALIRNAMNAALGLEQPPFLSEGPAFDLVVISAGDGVRAPLSTEIVSVVCDRLADVQHRRTNRIARSEGATVAIAAAL